MAKTKKPKEFLVTVTRTSYATREFKVTGATSAKKAREAALDKAGNFVFTEDNADYSIDGVIKTEPGQSSMVAEIKV